MTTVSKKSIVEEIEKVKDEIADYLNYHPKTPSHGRVPSIGVIQVSSRKWAVGWHWEKPGAVESSYDFGTATSGAQSIVYQHSYVTAG